MEGLDFTGGFASDFTSVLAMAGNAKKNRRFPCGSIANLKDGPFSTSLRGAKRTKQSTLSLWIDGLLRRVRSSQ
jgi:hypothetical protein